jgi:hypothetical protein
MKQEETINYGSVGKHQNRPKVRSDLVHGVAMELRWERNCRNAGSGDV